MVNVEEKVNALTKLADLVGKQTLVMWCLITTFTTGYLFMDGKKSQEARIQENKAAYERLVEEIKGIKITTEETKLKVDSTIPRLDTTLHNVNQTVREIKKGQ